MPAETESPDDVAGTLSRAVDAVLSRAADNARRLVASIDSDEKWAEKRRAKRAADVAVRSSGIVVDTIPGRKRRDPPLAARLQIQMDDHYRCRYAHCRRRTVDQRVVEALSRLVPDALPYHRNWGRQTTHGLVWTDLATIEHVLPWSVGGTNDRANLVTVCTCCQYAKMQRTPAQLGWSVCDDSGVVDDAWDGLTSTLGRLEELANDVVSSAHGQGAPAAVPSSKPRRRHRRGREPIDALDIAVGDHISVTPPEDRVRTPFRVDAVRADAVDLVYIWRDNHAGTWAESRTTRTLLTADLDDALLVSHEAPLSGDPLS